LHLFERPLSPLGPVIAGTIAGTTVFLLPSVFGFLVWELKENWKLYRASRAKELSPSRVGHHGETMAALMVPGFHSGTLPKLYARLRRAAQREQETTPKHVRLERRSEGSLGRFREGLQEVERAVRRFVERELCALITQSRRWPFGSITVASVELSSNRARVRLLCRALAPVACEITFEEQSHLIVASVARPGFVDALWEADEDARVLFENALAGLYQLASVDLVREQIEAALGHDVAYDVSDEGLVVWPGKGYRAEAIYPLRGRTDGPLIEPILRGEAPSAPPPPVDERLVLFRRQAISWSSWVYAWSADDKNLPSIPRLLQGPSILPAAAKQGAGRVRAGRG
jgi:hypothetical protein